MHFYIVYTIVILLLFVVVMKLYYDFRYVFRLNTSDPTSSPEICGPGIFGHAKGIAVYNSEQYKRGKDASFFLT